jgi:hypothetical protein
MGSCLLPVWFASMAGVGPQLNLLRPEGLDVPMPPSTEKTVVGTRLAHWVDTDNFTIQWADDWTTEADAIAAGEALERSWEVLIGEQGWDPPASGTHHKIWVILDPGLEGTGLTTGFPSVEYPVGLPVIYVNPIYSSDPDFFASLCAHEFGHALQFLVRDYYEGGPEEAWYWEATSEWMTEIVGPEWDKYAWQTTWYSTATTAPYDTVEQYHQYGMLLLNAYLDEYVLGTEGVWDIWWSNQSRPWLEEFAAATDGTVDDLWVDFVGAVGGGLLRESHLYAMPDPAPAGGEVEGYLGSAYVNLGAVSGSVEVQGGLGTLIRGEQWWALDGATNVPVGSEDVWVVVTNNSPEPAEYEVILGPSITVDEDTGGQPEDLAEEVEAGPSRSKAGGCAVAPTHPRGGWFLALLGLVCGVRFRRE